MKRLAIFLLSNLVTTSSLAQQSPSGCYVKDYSKEHLERHPDQVVDRMSILFGLPNADGYGWADVEVLLADQGHAARRGHGGMRVSGGGSSVNGSTLFHSGSCDGGAFEVVAIDENTITIETYRFHLGAGCGDEEGISSNLSEELLDADDLAISTQYILKRSELSACKW